MYATIDKALSDNIADIEAYLRKLKKELHIGEEGYPSKVIIAGDQQTYALRYTKKYPDHYLWMVTLYGDWHNLQLTAEILRDILWDGGLKQLSYALHETLFRMAVLGYYDTTDSNVTDYHKFTQWVEDVHAEANKNQTS